MIHSEKAGGLYQMSITDLMIAYQLLCGIKKVSQVLITVVYFEKISASIHGSI